MTNEEAIKRLKSDIYEYMDFTENPNENEFWTAFDMAIKALEAKDVLDKIRAEIKNWYWQADKQALAKDPCVVDAMVDLFIRTIDKYKAESEEV